MLLESLEARTLLSVAPSDVDHAWADVAGSQSRLPFHVPPSLELRNTAGGTLTSPASGDPLRIATAYLRANAPLLGLTQSDIDTALVTDQYTDEAGGGVTHIYFAQTHHGLRVANATLNINITADGRVANVGSSFVPGLGPAAAPLTTAPALGAHEAIVAAGSAFGLESTVIAMADRGGPAAMISEPAFEAAGFSRDPIAPQQIFVPQPGGGLRLGWNMQLRTPDGRHWYNTTVDATTGELLMAADWASAASYHVFPAPAESPSEQGRIFVNDPHDPEASPFGWHDTNGVAGAEFTDTRGNNVSAQEDQNADDTGGFRPSGGPNLVFDFPFNTAQEPSAYRDAAITNLFYWNNLLHDVHYQYGFNEVAGNFQQNNYGKGGLGGDPVQADAQDGSGVNNANMFTPPDGQPARMQQFLFDLTSPGRDSSLANEIIVHEYGHGVSIRLTGGPANSDSLSALQSAGMGEGWADWWALMFTQDSGDTKLAAYPQGNYVLGQPNDGPGIRTFPYSFDMSINPLTLSRHSQNPEVHASGELWASALWDMNWLLIDKYGYEPNLAAGYQGQGSAGNLLAMQLVADGLKLQPANPTFTQARDAIVLADELLTGGRNAKEIWTAFARRGFGLSADADDGNGPNSVFVVEAFDLPILDLHVTTSTPEENAIVSTPVTQYELVFSQPFVPATVQASDLMVNGVPATAVTIVDDSTLRFSYGQSPVVDQGPQVMTMAEGVLTSAIDGLGSTPFERVFRYDTLRMEVVSTTPPNGSSVTLPLTQVDVHLNEAFDPASVSVGDLRLSQGSVESVQILDADSLRFQLSGINQETTLQLELNVGAIHDAYGNPNRQYAGFLHLDIGVVPFQGELESLRPHGSLAHAGTVEGIIGVGGDTDTFTLQIEAGQLLALRAASELGWQPNVIVRDSQGNVISSAGIPSPGTVLLPAVRITQAGAYAIEVGAPAGATGSYALTAMLNVVHESEEFAGGENNSRESAQSLEAAFISADGVAERALVEGRAAAVGDAPVEIEPNNTNVTATPLVGNFGEAAGDLYQLEITASQNTFSDFDWYKLGELQIGDQVTIAGAGADTGRGTAFGIIVQLYRFVDGAPVLVTSDVGSGPGNDGLIQRFAIPTTGEYYVGVDDFSTVGTYRLSVLLENTGASPQTIGAVTAESEPNDDVTAADDISASWRKIVRESFTTGTIANFDDSDNFRLEMKIGDLLNVDVKASAGWQPRVELFGPRGPALAFDTGAGLPGQAGVYVFRAQFAGNFYVRVGSAFGSGDYAVSLSLSSATPPIAAVALPDYYSVELAAGESLSLAGESLDADAIDLELRDEAGNVLANGLGSNGGVRQSIHDFLAPSAGTYYAVVNANRGPRYRLLAARDASIERELNDDPNAAQAVESRLVQGAQRLLGRVAPNRSEVTTFSELPFQPVDDVAFNHVTFDFKLNGGDSVDASFGGVGPGATKFTDGIGIEGNAGGLLGFEFDVPTRKVEFGVVLNNSVSLPGAVVVELFDQHGATLAKLPVELRPEGFFYSEARFVYSGAPVSRAVLDFDERRAARFLVDNLTYELDGGVDLYPVTVVELGTLVIETLTPGDAPGAPPNTLNPQLRLLDASGNPVAEDDDSAADGRNAKIEFIIPRGIHTYYVEVSASAAEPYAQGDYLLKIGKPAHITSPFAVSAIAPSDGSRLRGAPTTVNVTFNGGVLVSSLAPGDLLVDGLPAMGVDMLSGDAARFTLPAISGDGVHRLSFAEGALSDLQGTPLAAFSSQFIIDTVAPRIVGASVAEGSVVPSGDGAFTFTFGEPMRVDVDVRQHLQLFSITQQEFLNPASWNWNVAGDELTVLFAGLSEGNYELRLHSRDGGFEDAVGINLDGESNGQPIPPGQSGNGLEGGDFLVRFVTDVDVADFSVPLLEAGPGGSLVYRGAAEGLLGSPRDSDTFELALDAGQTLTLVAHGDALRPIIELYDPNGLQIALDVATFTGDEAIISIEPLHVAGKHRIVIHDLGLATGAYVIDAYLNADLEYEHHGSSANDTREAAQTLHPALVGMGDLSVTNVLGRANRPEGLLPAEFEPNNTIAAANLASANFDEVDELYQISIKGSIVGTRTGPDWFAIGAMTAGDIVTVSLAGLGSGRGALGGAHLELYAGPNTAPVLVAADYSGSGSGGDSLIYRYQVSGSDSYHVRVVSDGINFGTYELTVWLENGGRPPRADGELTSEVEPNNTAATANIASNAWRAVEYQSATSGATAADGIDTFAYDFHAGDVATTILTGQGPVDTSLVWRGADGAVLATYDGFNPLGFRAGFVYGMRIPTDGRYYLEVLSPSPGSYLANVFLQSPEAPAEPVATSDYYRVDLPAGEPLSLAVKAQRGAPAELWIEDGAGNILVTASLTSDNFGKTIPEFVTPAAGPYYIGVRGTSGEEYALTLLRGAGFDLEKNNALAEARPLSPTGRQLGAIKVGGSTRLFATAIDGRNMIVELDPLTGAELNQFVAPEGVSGGPDGLAYLGESLFYVNAFGPTRQLYELDPDTGQVLDADLIAGGNFDGLAALHGRIYLADFGSSTFYEFDPDSDQVTKVFTIPGLGYIGGLAGAAEPNRLIATVNFGASVVEIDVETGLVTHTFNTGGGFAGVAVVNDEVYLSYLGALPQIDVYSRAGALLRAITLPYTTSALGGDGGSVADEDWYRIEVSPGKALALSTRTPGDADGEFINGLDPAIELYDANGQLVAANDNAPGMGLNAALQFSGPGGVYYIRVIASAGNGEYILDAEQLTSAIPGDTDFDGDVDITDLNNVRNGFGGDGLGDTFPFDGQVDIHDLNAVRNNLDADPPPAPARPRPTVSKEAPVDLTDAVFGRAVHATHHEATDQWFSLIGEDFVTPERKPLLRRR